MPGLFPNVPDSVVPPFSPAKVAIAATFAHYPFLQAVDLRPRTTSQLSLDGWIITVWFGTWVYKRVVVKRDGQAQLLPSDQPL